MKSFENIDSFEVVHSSTISEIGYDNKLSSLFVKFKKGAIYKYSGVPQVAYTVLKSINDRKESVGSYYSKEVKGKYGAVKI